MAMAPYAKCPNCHISNVRNDVLRCVNGHIYCDGCGIDEGVLECKSCPRCQGAYDDWIGYVDADETDDDEEDDSATPFAFPADLVRIVRGFGYELVKATSKCVLFDATRSSGKRRVRAFLDDDDDDYIRVSVVSSFQGDLPERVVAAALRRDGGVSKAVWRVGKSDGRPALVVAKRVNVALGPAHE